MSDADALYSEAELFTGDPLKPDLEQVCPEGVLADLTRAERTARVNALIEQSHQILDLAWSTHAGERRRAAWVVLFSGGNDSTVLAHLVQDRVDVAAHLDTTIGVPATRQFVRDTCNNRGLDLLVQRAPVDYRDLVLGRWQGFPGPAHHQTTYQRLKERPLDAIRSEIVTDRRNSRVLLVAGRRRAESKRRATVPLHEPDGSAIWASPLAMWTKTDMTTYRLMMGDVPLNPVTDHLGMSGECLCLAADTLVLTADGWKEIQHVTVDDRVFGRGKFSAIQIAPVARVFKNEPKPMLHVKTYFLPAMEATDNHPLWVRDYRYRMRASSSVQVVGGPRFAEARELHEAFLRNKTVSPSKMRRHYIGRPFRTEQKPLNLSAAHLRLLGHFVAEGAYQWSKDQYRNKAAGVVFTVSWKSRELAQDIAQSLREAFDIEPGWREYTDQRTGREFITVRCGKETVSNFIKKYTHGRYCWEKSFSEEVITASVDQQAILLDAMWMGDGSEYTVTRRSERVSAYRTTSKILALQVQEMLLRRGEIYGINTGHTEKRPSYLVRRTVGKTRNGFIEDGVLWTGVQAITESPPQPTFNLMVVGEPNYLTESGLVHNCGAYAQPGELERLRFWYPDTAAEIDELQADVKAAGIPEPFCRWGHGKGKPAGVGKMCTSCDLRQMGLFDEVSA